MPYAGNMSTTSYLTCTTGIAATAAWRTHGIFTHACRPDTTCRLAQANQIQASTHFTLRRSSAGDATPFVSLQVLVLRCGGMRCVLRLHHVATQCVWSGIQPGMLGKLLTHAFLMLAYFSLLLSEYSPGLTDRWRLVSRRCFRFVCWAIPLRAQEAMLVFSRMLEVPSILLVRARGR